MTTMTAPHETPRGTKPLARRTVALIAVIASLATLGGVTLAARPMLAREEAQAHTLVDEGQRAFAKGDLGTATLALERARYLAPRASFVRAAIEAAQVHDAETAAQRIVRLVTSAEWSCLAVALGWIAGIAAAISVVRRRLLAPRLSIAVAAGFLVSMLGVVASSATSAAVVTSNAPDATARIAPYPDAPVVGPLPAGTLVEQTSEHGTFVRVRSGDGLEGWVPLSRLSPIAGQGG